MANLLAYAGCLHRFQLNDFGHIKIDIFTYDISTEKFLQIANNPLTLSTTMQCQKCTVVGSYHVDKGLLVLVHLLTTNNSVLMLIRLQSRPWICQIVATIPIPSTIGNRLEFLSMNASMSIFIKNEDIPRGFYTVDHTQKCSRNIEFIICPLTKYFYCQTNENYYWLMGIEIDSDTEQKIVKVYYGCSSSPSDGLIGFKTEKFFPVSLIDNIQNILVLNYKFQLQTRSIIGNLIVSNKNCHIYSCQNGIICHQLQFESIITSILSYDTIDNGLLLLFIQNEIRSVEIIQYESFVLFTDTPECADSILIDDFAQTGWKQLVLFKFDHEITFDSFLLTDFSQTHVFHQTSDFEHNSSAHALTVDMDDDDVQSSLALAQDLLRKKIINADFIVSEGHFQCRKLESEIRKVSNKHHVADLITHTPSNHLIQSSTSILQLINTTWFIYRTKLFVYCTIKNISNIPLSHVYPFGIDKQNNKQKLFNLKHGFESFSNEHTSFRMEMGARERFILTTSIDLNKDIDLHLFVLVDNKLFQIGTIVISIDDLINSNSNQRLHMDQLETGSLAANHAMVYVNFLFRLDIRIDCKSKFHTIEYLQQMLTNIDFKHLTLMSNIYFRVHEGTAFEHILVHLVNTNDDINNELIVHIYAGCANEAVAMVRYLLSKLDFHSLSLIEQHSSSHKIDTFTNRFCSELNSCMNTLQQIPTVMRKITPTSKSESYRLLKSENFHSFQMECHLTDLFLTSLLTS